MRIRKNADVSSLLIMSSSQASGVEALLQPHVCHLNQSPWDVIPLSFLDSPLPLHPKSEGEDSFNGTASLNNSISALESFVEEKKVTIKKKMDELVIDDNGFKEESKKKMATKKKEGFVSRKIFCQKNDGKGCHCKNQPMEGHSICEYHLLKCPASGDNYHNAITTGKCLAASAAAASAKKKKKKKEKKEEDAVSRGPVKRGSSSSSSSKGSANPYEFYYYSGFGPSWRKRRGGEEGMRGGNINDQNGNFNLVTPTACGGESNITTTLDDTAPSSPVSSPQREGFGYVFDCEFDDDDDLGLEDNGVKKRIRKPVKARSLKSLM